MQYFHSESVILQVRKYPCLYDMNNLAFKNKDLKRDAWICVAKELVGENVWNETSKQKKEMILKEVARRWKSIRDSYQKSLRYPKGTDGKDRKKPRPYIFEKHMGFLRNVWSIKDRMITGKMDMDWSPETLPESDSTESHDEPPPPVSEPVTILRVLKPKPPPPEKDSTESYAEPPPPPPPVPTPVTILRVLKPKPEIVNDPNQICTIKEAAPIYSFDQSHMQMDRTPDRQMTNFDADEMFFMSQMPLIKRLNPHEKIDFQLKFMQLLHSYSVPQSSTVVETIVSTD